MKKQEDKFRGLFAVDFQSKDDFSRAPDRTGGDFSVLRARVPKSSTPKERGVKCEFGARVH